MKQRIGIWYLALAVAVIIGCTHFPKSGDSYVLRVKLQDVYNRNFVMETPVMINQPFGLTNYNGKVRNTITGVLKSPVGGKFPLDLSVSEWESEKSNVRDSEPGKLYLELDKPRSCGFTSSFIYMRTVTLSKKTP